ncbi:hypothetical protein SCHPADRAFT_894144 [Schizopora paradoxa]|uniref:Uncharacterized protein n=1 Tax=Schizopora paradoxa TaxID=27342 RepID=A0A0H2REV8_9AGAM|nr:hypothetical protein SCHPADRAFT_894144 [Schizopora paradoxa]
MELTRERNAKARVVFDSESDDVLDAVSSWLGHEVALPVELEKEINTLKSLSCTDVRGDPNLRKHVRGISCRLHRLLSSLEEISTAVKGEINGFEAVTCKCGIAMLPDEVLLTIFEMAIQSWNEWSTIRLSHVNRQFRAIMLACPRLWTGMDSSREMVKSCFPRTRGLPLNVYLSVYCFAMPDECRFDLVLTELLPLAKHWGALRMYFNSLTTGDERRHRSLSGLMMSRASVDAPILKHLTLQGEHHSDVPVTTVPAFNWSQWNCPQLRKLDAEHYFPLNLPGLSNVSTLSLTLRVNNPKISEILAQIAGMKNMTDLALELSNTFYESEIIVFERFEVPQVRRLRITTTLHFLNYDISPALKRSIFSSLFFPGAEELYLKINGGDYTDYERFLDDTWTRDYFFNKEVNRIFRHVEQFPLVHHFHFRIRTPFGDHHDSEGYSNVTIPFNMLPSLKHFILNVNTSFDIEEPADPDETYFEEEDAVAPRVIGDAFPVLDSMTLDMGEPSVAAKWLKRYLHEMKDRGRWNELFKLEVFVYRLSAKFDALRDRMDYEGEEALAWCEEVLERKCDEEAQQAA